MTTKQSMKCGIHPSTQIHPTAVIASGASIGEGSSIGPYCIIGAQVSLGARSVLHSHVVIDGITQANDDNQFFPFATIGTPSQHLKYKGEPTTVEIGSQNVFREYVTVHRGTIQGNSLTKIGSGNYFMANSHVGHDCIVGNHNIMANSAALAGHVEFGDFVTMGGLSGIHQFARVGSYALVGAGAMVVDDIPPGCTCQGDRAGVVSLNKIGLERRGVSKEEIAVLKRVFRKVYLGAGLLEERLAAARQVEGAAEFPLVQSFIGFFANSKRGVMVARRRLVKASEEE